MSRSRDRDRGRRGQNSGRGPAADQGELVLFGFEVVQGDAELFDVTEPVLAFGLVNAVLQVALDGVAPFGEEIVGSRLADQSGSNGTFAGIAPYCRRRRMLLVPFPTAGVPVPRFRDSSQAENQHWTGIAVSAGQRLPVDSRKSVPKPLSGYRVGWRLMGQ